MIYLNEICNIFSGYALKSFNKDEYGMPVIKIGNINQDGSINLLDCSYSDEKVDEKFISQRNDIYVALSGATTGKVGLMKEDGYIINQRVGIVRPKNIDIPILYLMYFLQSKTEKMLADATGVAQPNISPKQISCYVIPSVNIVAMQVISEKLKTVDDLIKLRQKQLSKLDELVKSRFIDLFGDQKNNPHNLPVGKLSDVADIYLGLTHTPEYVLSGKPFLSVKDISSGSIDFSKCHYITDEEFDSLPKGARPQIGDLLFCRVGTIGKPVEIPFGTPEFGTFVSVGYLRRKPTVLNCYLKAWMNDDYFMQQVMENVAGASQINLNTGWLKNFRILIPSVELQSEFAAFVEHSDKLKLSVQQSLEKLETLKQALMQKYFR